MNNILAVFASWGKSCLRAGNFRQAREKLQYCFEQVSADVTTEYNFASNDNIEVHQNVFYPNSIRENKPLKDSPLLTEIIQILESLSTSLLSDKVIQEYKKNTFPCSYSSSNIPNNITCLIIQNKIKNIDNLCNGIYYNKSKHTETRSNSEYEEKNTKPRFEPVLYEECLHYLFSYGSHLSLLKFYIKYGEFSNALNYIINKSLSSDIFVEIYMVCLKNGTFISLQEQMSHIDPSLNVWKV